MPYTIPITGTGRVDVAAYGVADAEHLVEKELGARWPEARLLVTEVKRHPGAARIVEEFSISYRLHAVMQTEGADEAEARRAAFRVARDRLADSRYRHTRWDAAAEKPTG